MAHQETWEWLAAHDADLRRVAERVVPSGAYDHEDALHDAYLRSLERLDVKQNPASYVLQAARHAATDRWRYDRVRNWQTVADDDHEYLSVPVGGSVEAQALGAVELEVALERCQAFPVAQREVMYYRMCGTPESEIARLTGVPLGTVKTRRTLALRKLREKA